MVKHSYNTDRLFSPARGSALLIVFWAVAVMSICVLGLIGYLYSDLDETTALKYDSRARQLAESGVAVALNPGVAREDPVLKETLAPGEGFEVALRSEGGRLNINTIIQKKDWVALQNLFEEWGMQAADIANLIHEFQGGDGLDLLGPNVVPAPNQTGNKMRFIRQFQSVDDMLSVPGMELVAQARPDWRDYFTVLSDGPLDVNDAPASLIAAVTGVGGEQAGQFVNVRNGPDGLPGTQDDIVFKDLDQVRSLLGMSREIFAGIEGLLSVQDSAMRIESTGSLGTYRRKITVVARRNVSPPVFLLWQEL